MYKSLKECLEELESINELIRITEQVDPYLEMASIHLRVHAKGGPAILFENIKGCRYKAVSNLFGTTKRTNFLFRKSITPVQQLIDIKNDPLSIFEKPLSKLKLLKTIKASKPIKISESYLKEFEEINIEDLPQITHWPMDGGAFITLPQVYSEDPFNPGIKSSNLGMYRVQLSGNDYIKNKEIGLHYQIHRGIGIHQRNAISKNEKLKVSIFIGGPPAHTLAAVMPLPEGMSELNFAGAIGQKSFRYFYHNNYMISADADFVITGYIENGLNKPEGPFGDHLGYYSLKHDFPVLKVEKVLARKNAIWPFTVVGRPPQEDTGFGNLIHHISGSAIPKELPGVKEVHAVDAAGVHPLLLAIGSERYTPYLKSEIPSELLTQANRILGSGQLSLAKFLFIQSENNLVKDCRDIKTYFHQFLQRFNPENDLHFHTNTSIDTLDYSGTGLNTGSKLVIAAHGKNKRELSSQLPANLLHREENFQIVAPGILSFKAEAFTDYQSAEKYFHKLNEKYSDQIKELQEFPLWIACDDPDFMKESFDNFLWQTFTRCNPSHDVYGIKSEIKNKHWLCKGPLLFDARKKPHHAPELMADAKTLKNIERFFIKGTKLENY